MTPPAYTGAKQLVRPALDKMKVNCPSGCSWDDYNPMLMGVHDRVHSAHVCTKPEGKCCPGQNKQHWMTNGYRLNQIVPRIEDLDEWLPGYSFCWACKVESQTPCDYLNCTKLLEIQV